MRASTLPLRPARARARRRYDVRPIDVLAVLAAAVYLAAVATSGWDDREWFGYLLPVAPIAAFLAVFVKRPWRPVPAAALGASALTVLAIAAAVVATENAALILVLPGLVLSALGVRRFPRLTLGALLVSAGFFGSLDAIYGFSAPPLVDALLGGLWLGALWAWASGERRRAARAWLGLGLLVLYALISLAAVFDTYSLTAGVQSYRGGTWYLGAVVLLAYTPFPESVRRAALKLAIVVTALTGAYAALRWQIGPAAQEEAVGRLNANNFLDDELRPLGSFPTTKILSASMAAALPFLGAMALVRRDRYAVVAFAGFVATLIALLAADVRAGVAAAAVGCGVTLVLYQLSQGFNGRRGPAVVVAVVVVIVGGGAAFSATIGDKNDSSNRFRAILDPESDASYQARLFKWNSAIDDIDERPFGYGLGTAGRTQARYGEFRTIGSLDIDNSYLKVAYEQGFILMVLLAAGLALTLGQLVLHAITSTDPARAGPAIAASGTMTTLLVLYFVGDYIEGLHNLTAWIVIGLGVAQFSWRPEPEGQPAAV